MLREFWSRHAGFGALLLLLVPLAAAATPTTRGKWAPFAPEKGRFRVELPAAPKHEQSTDWSVLGRVVTQSWVASRDADLFIVNYTDLPGMALMGGPSYVYQGSRERLLRDNGGREVEFRDTHRGGREGKLLLFRTPETSERPALDWRAEMFLVAKRLYLVIGATRRGEATAALDRFFRSVNIHAD